METIGERTLRAVYAALDDLVEGCEELELEYATIARVFRALQEAGLKEPEGYGSGFDVWVQAQ